tara:strand:- start:5752 stop:7203 length:1452 start_codon:yes stop_codon:yes gene_type:complete
MKFGTSGLRGLVTDLEGRLSALYSTAFAHHLIQNGLAKPGDRIFVGEDYRPSSRGIAATCIGALERSGLRPVSCGALPTPALAYYAMSKGRASLMITGSHIPADRNGIKFYRPDGEIDKNDEHSITLLASECDATLKDITPGNAESEAAEAKLHFSARTSHILPVGALSGLKVGVYQHSSVARDELVETIASYGAEIISLGRTDTFIPVDTEAVSSATIALLKKWTVEHRLDAIVSADGDGDRPLVSDEHGTPLRGDLLGLMVARLLKPDVIVTPVTSNSGIKQSAGCKVFRTRVGSPFVIEGMTKAVGAGAQRVLGFEANGGVLLGSDFRIEDRNLTALPTRDCFLPILAALMLARQESLSLSALVAQFALPIAAADRLENFPLEVGTALMSHLNTSPQNLSEWFSQLGPVSEVNAIDGLRIVLADERIIHLRPSGNAPEMRCYVEAKDQEGAQALLQQGLSMLRNWATESAHYPQINSETD